MGRKGVLLQVVGVLHGDADGVACLESVFRGGDTCLVLPAALAAVLVLGCWFALVVEGERVVLGVWCIVRGLGRRSLGVMNGGLKLLSEVDWELEGAEGGWHFPWC